MTEREHLDFDAAQNAGADAVAECDRLLAAVPDDMHHTAARNRIVMAMQALEQARDFLAAARDRMPETERGA